MAEPKTYVPKSSAKVITFDDGGSIMKLNFHAETMAEFVRNHANERGYITFGVTKRREVSERGDTHCVWLDKWKPTQRALPPGGARREQPDLSDLPPGAKRPEADQDVPF